MQFTNTSCNALTYEWDFGDGHTDTLKNPTHIYANTGIYTVKLKVFNSCGMDMTTRTISVVDYPEAAFAQFLDPGNACGPTIDSFINLSNAWSNTVWKITPNDTSKWMFTDTLMTVGSEHISIFFKKVGLYYVELKAFNACGEDILKDTIEIYEPPLITLAPPEASCDEIVLSSADLDFGFSGAITSFQWTFTNGSPATASGSSFSSVTFNSAGSVTLHITSPCGDQTISVPVVVGNTAPISFPGIPPALCINQAPVSLAAMPANGVWAGLGPAAGSISPAGVLDPSTLPPGVYTFTYSLGTVDCPNEESIEIEILPAVSIAIQPVDTVCEQLSYTPVVNYEGGIASYQWSFPGATPASFSGAAPANILYPDPGVYTAVGTVSGQCGTALDSVTIVVLAQTVLTIDPLPGIICSSSAPFNLNANQAGGIWSGPGISDPLTGLFDPSLVTPGQPIQVTYAYQQSACANSISVTFEVTQSETLAVQDEVLCADSPPVSLESDQAGGTWSGTGITDAIAGIFDPAVSGQGTFQPSYAWTDPAGCPVVASASVLVEAIPLINVSDTSLLCLSTQDIDLNTVLNYQPSPAGGTTQWSGQGLINMDGLFNSGTAGLSPGVYEVEMVYTRNACVVRDSAWIELIANPQLSLSPDTLICIDQGTLLLHTSLAGGNWSGPGIDPVTGIIDLQAAGGGLKDYQYVFEAGTSCEQTAAAEVEILDPGAGMQAGPDIEVCEGVPMLTLSGFSPAGGTWSGPGLLDDAAGIIDLQQLQTDTFYTFTYCIESQQAAGCSACRSRTVRINALPEILYQFEGLPCIGQVFSVINQSSNVSSHSWDFGDNTGSSDAQPAHIYTQAGTYTLTYVASSAFGCKDTFSQQVFVTTPPIADFTLDITEGCAPLAVSVTNNSSGYNISQAWYIQEDTIAGNTPGNFLIDQISTDTVINIRLAVTNICGTVLDDEEILVHPYPIVDFGVNADEGCSPLLIDFANTTIGNPANFSWDLGNGVLSSDTVPPPQYYTSSDTAISEYIVTLISSNLCGADTLTKTITVFPPDVQAFIELDTLQGCQPFMIVPKSYSTPGASVTWSVLNAQQEIVLSSNETAPVFEVQDSGLYSIILYASRCGTDSDTAYFRVLPAPEVSFSHVPYICAGSAIVFSDSSLNASGYLWDFGDGGQSTDISPSHTYSDAGTYTINLTAYSVLNNCPASFQSTVLVVSKPLAGFEASLSQGCGPLSVAFSNSSSGQDSILFAWNFGDGTSGDFTKDPTHIFEDAGTFTVGLTVYDNYGCFSDTATSFITVHPDPQASFQIQGGPFCQGYDTIRLQNTSIDAVAYEWTIEGNMYGSQDFSFLPQASGILPIQLVVSNIFQCKDTSDATVSILASPLAAATPDSDKGCEDLRIHFSNSSQHADFYSWHFGDMTSSTDPDPQHVYMDAGNYTATLIVQSANGCPPDTAYWPISVFPAPLAQFSYDKSRLCGIPVAVTLSNQSQGALDYAWSFGDGNTSDIMNPIHEYQEIGNHLIQLITSNAYQCRDTMEQWIDIFGQALAAVGLPQDKGCAPMQMALVNNSEQALSYQWIIDPLGVSTDENPLLTFTEPGTYSIRLIATYNAFCADTLDLVNAIEVFQAPLAAFSYEADASENMLGDVIFTNLSQQADRFFWELGDGSTATTADVYHEYDINRSIAVLLYAFNDNQGRYTCTDTASMNIDPEWITTFYAPNAMTPGYGQEGIRVFKPVGIGIEEYEIAVYSPWGEMLWRSTELKDHSPAGSWDGSYKGEIVPQGAYAWLAKMTFVDGTTRVEKGTVTVLR